MRSRRSRGWKWLRAKNRQEGSKTYQEKGKRRLGGREGLVKESANNPAPTSTISRAFHHHQASPLHLSVARMLVCIDASIMIGHLLCFYRTDARSVR